MPHDDTSAPLVRIGDVAAASGLSVRTLHHYEDIGLIEPDARSDAGHRLYGPTAMARIYRVQLLRRLGLSLDAVARALDDPAWDLTHALAHHRDALDRSLGATARLRSQVDALLASLERGDTADVDALISILEDMTMLDSLVRQRISILVYTDLEAAFDELTGVFGLLPGELTRDDDGTVVHAELHAGDGVIWLHHETDEFGLASPQSVGAATGSMAVMVADVDEHHRRAAALGADVVYPPVDQPYGYREYSARDSEGQLWSFMAPLT